MRPPIRPLRDADTQALGAVLARRWQVMGILVAKQLVYSSAEQSEVNEADLGDITPVSDN